MTLNSSSSNTILYTNTSTVHEKSADTIEKLSPNSSKYDQNSISNVAIDDNGQSFETLRKKLTVSLYQVPKHQ